MSPDADAPSPDLLPGGTNVPRLPGLDERVKALRPNVFIAQPRRDAKRPLPQLVHDAEYVGAPFACITKYGITDGLPVDQARNDLMHHALRMGAEYIWFVDDDTVVPYDALYKLHGAARLGYPVVGGVVTGKHVEPSQPFVACVADELLYVPDVSPRPDLPTREALVEVTWITGFACLLIHTDVLRRMLAEDPSLPFAWFFYDKRGYAEVGEDTYFCRRCINLGIPIVVHRNVHCRHYDLDTGQYWGGDPAALYYLHREGQRVRG